MKNVFLIILTAMLSMVVFEVHAERRGAELEAKAWVVERVFSEQGETRDQFIWRLAKFMRKWSDENNAEICGHLAGNGQGWGIILITHRSQLTCVMDKRMIPEGYVAEPDNIHSHPRPEQRGWMRLTQDTIDFERATGVRLMVNRVKTKVGFSDNDFLTGTGYLVDTEELFYQSGRNKVQRLGPLN